MKHVRIVLWAALLLGGLQAAWGGPPDAGPASAESAAPASTPAAAPRPFTPPELPPLPTLGEGDGVGQTVVVVPIRGTIDQGLAPYVKRSLEVAKSRGARAIVLDVDTFGGRVDAAVIIRDALLSAEVPVIAFVNRRAISAGALISYAADFIAFTNGASMGAATPIQVEGARRRRWARRSSRTCAPRCGPRPRPTAATATWPRPWWTGRSPSRE
ncbi:MAG: hypothetical protein R3F60_30230 [bacterium]